MTSADKRRVRKALDGAGFPASKQDLITYAEERSAGGKTSEALHALPEGEYRDVDEVERHVPQSPAAHTSDDR